MLSRDHFYFAILHLLVMVWLSSDWYFKLPNPTFWINPQIIHIEHATIQVQAVPKRNNVFVFQINNQQAKAACQRVQAASEHYQILCDRNLAGQTMQASDIEFLDSVSPKLDGIILKGKFLLNGKQYTVNIPKNSAYIADFLRLKKVEFIMMYAFFLSAVLAFLYIVVYAFACFSLKRFI
ncbi:hypothetical protein ACKLNO_02900 [Neisseriaceae bacterium B1]